MSNELRHYGVKGMKWGVRRYQNYDGSYTAAGKNRYGYSYDPYVRRQQKRWDRKARRRYAKAYNRAADYARQVLIPQHNQKWSKFFETFNGDRSNPKYKQYYNEYMEKFDNVVYNNLVYMIGEDRPE